VLAPSSPPPAALPSSPAVALPPPQKPASYWSPARAFALSFGVIGLAGIGVGAVFGLEARSTYDASNRNGHCDAQDACDPTGKSLRAEADRAATLSTITFGAGAAALTSGILLYVLSPRGKPSSLAMVPLVGPREATVSFARRW
jgi:hypothetical protein